MHSLHRHCVLVAVVLAADVAAAWVSPAVAQYVYGTNSSGQSCIANGVDCSAPMPSVPSGPRRPVTSVYAAVASADPQDVIGYGIGSGFNSRAAAEAAALKGCEEQAAKNNPKYRKIRACSAKLWFYDRCGAFAISQDGAAGWSQSPSLNRAQASAMKYCQQNTKQKCTFLRAWCVHG